MQHEGNFHLDDVRHLTDDNALREILGLKKIPKAICRWWGIIHCNERHKEYAIRAKTSATLKAQIASRTEEDWIPFIIKQGELDLTDGDHCNEVMAGGSLKTRTA